MNPNGSVRDILKDNKLKISNVMPKSCDKCHPRILRMENNELEQ